MSDLNLARIIEGVKNVCNIFLIEIGEICEDLCECESIVFVHSSVNSCVCLYE